MKLYRVKVRALKGVAKLIASITTGDEAVYGCLHRVKAESAQDARDLALQAHQDGHCAPKTRAVLSGGGKR